MHLYLPTLCFCLLCASVHAECNRHGQGVVWCATIITNDMSRTREKEKEKERMSSTARLTRRCLFGRLPCGGAFNHQARCAFVPPSRSCTNSASDGPPSPPPPRPIGFVPDLAPNIMYAKASTSLRSDSLSYAGCSPLGVESPMMLIMAVPWRQNGTCWIERTTAGCILLEIDMQLDDLQEIADARPH